MSGASQASQERYLPIAEHGLIGDLHTVALVGTDGTIDWYCCPRFDSPSVFGAILDADRGGLFRISTRLRRLERQAALPARHQHPHHALPDA
jgi:GH15 family glucan-1,4-alpha-glucosidase